MRVKCSLDDTVFRFWYREVARATAKRNKDGEWDHCTICWECFRPRVGVYVLPCKHMFHMRCGRRWILRHSSCPVCRFRLELSLV
jgi:hypothetical protein